MSEENQFSYSYFAPTEEERRQIESIRGQYLGRTAAEAKLELMKKLDGRVHKWPAAAAIMCGALGLLIFGGGLALCLEGALAAHMAVGIVLSVVGFAVMLVAKPLYSRIQRALTSKYGDTILKLSAELLGGDGDEK